SGLTGVINAAPTMVRGLPAKIVRVPHHVILIYDQAAFLLQCKVAGQRSPPERSYSSMQTEYTHQLSTEVTIQGQALTSADVIAVARHYAPVTLGHESIARIEAARAAIERIADEDQKVYGD